MKRNAFLILLLAVLAALSGYLFSKASLVGRMGINLFYKEYKFLKVWWKGALLVFAAWMLLYLLQRMVQKKLAPIVSRFTHIAAIIIALAGLYFTYSDFRHTTSHRWLGERFHLGGYLFWIGWIIISLFCLTEKKKHDAIAPSDNTQGRDGLQAGEAKW